MNVRGLYGSPPPLPATPGNDAAGVVSAVGEGVSGLEPGDRVILLLGATEGRGTWVESVCVQADRLVPTPPVLTDAQAGALWVNYLTVWVMLEELLQLRPGETLLQTASGSQLGRAVMEHAAWKGLRLVNVVRRREQAEELRAAGQTHVAVLPGDDLPTLVRDATGGHGAAAAIDAVGGKTGAAVLDALTSGGRAILYGALDGGRAVPVDPGPFLFRELRLQGFWLTRWLRFSPPDRVMAATGAVLGAVGEGRYRPAVDCTFPFEEVRAAAQHAERPGRKGAVVLV